MKAIEHWTIAVKLAKERMGEPIDSQGFLKPNVLKVARQIYCAMGYGY